MDHIHRADEREGISEKIHLKSYFEEYKKSVQNARISGIVENENLPRHLVKSMVYGRTHDVGKFGDCDAILDDDTFDDVEEMCSIEKLSVEGECHPVKIALDEDELSIALAKVKKFEAMPIPEEGKSILKTLQSLDTESELDSRRRIMGLRHANDIWFEATPKVPTKFNRDIINKEVVVFVRVYKPMKNTPRQPISTCKYTQEIALLASSPLSDLRDFIKCPLDYVIPQDVSDDPFAKSKNPLLSSWDSKRNNRDVYKSGFFYIEGCFYNDMRWPECIDYSTVIRDWALNPKRKVGPFTSAKMEETHLEDLVIRFGYPYVFVHQGDHEHLFTFNEARLLSPDDPQKKRIYPFERSVGFIHSKYCMACSSRVAKWITTGNDRVPEDPYFFCDECFKEFNYDENGIKKSNFKAYNFVEANVL